MLGIDEDHEGDTSGEESEALSTSTQIVTKKRLAKQKKGGRGKKAQGRQQNQVAKGEASEKIPLESYCFIKDEIESFAGYLVAVYSLVQEWSELRSYIEGLWHQVSYGGLNSAVAATMSNIAIAMLKKTEAEIFLDFPGRDSYATVMQTIFKGNLDKIRGIIFNALRRVNMDSKTPQ